MIEVLLKLMTSYNTIVIIAIFMALALGWLLGLAHARYLERTKKCPKCHGDGFIRRKKK